MRLDAYLAQHEPDFSRSQWQKYLSQGYVTVNGQVESSAKRILGETDEVQTSLPPAPDFATRTLPIIHEDQHVLVINKPVGVLTHAKGVVTEEFTVADFVKTKMTEPDNTNRPGIVHRLDRRTSGVLITAKDSATKLLLQKQFQDKKAKKTYLALVKGEPKHNQAKIDSPIERNPKKPATFRVGAGGKAAETSYKVLETNGQVSLLELKPVTGRTHQLRVHLNHIGHPIIGDELYGGVKSPIGRLCLHAWKLEITIPTSQRRVFEAKSPKEFEDIVK